MDPALTIPKPRTDGQAPRPLLGSLAPTGRPPRTTWNAKLLWTFPPRKSTQDPEKLCGTKLIWVPWTRPCCEFHGVGDQSSVPSLGDGAVDRHGETGPRPVGGVRRCVPRRG